MGRTTEELREQIMQAFASRRYPGDDEIADRDARYPDYEGNAVAAFFRGKDWRRVTFAALRDEYRHDATACLSFMRDEGFCYYLPAFLLMALELDGSAIGESLCFSLTDPGPTDQPLHGRFCARVARLSSAEKEAVTHLLRFLADDYDRAADPMNPARAALQSYWERTTAHG